MNVLFLLVALLTSQGALAAGPNPVPRFELPSATESGERREVSVDVAPFTSMPGKERVGYAIDEVLRPITVDQLKRLPEWALAVRLILGEVGVGRLHGSRWGMLEAIAILETVNNRLDPEAWNPEGVPGMRAWPGCGEDGTFSSCASPNQYYALRDRRALDPGAMERDKAALLHAIDVAVAAWWLHATHAVSGVSDGATSFIHRCGGTAYGENTPYCDGSPSTPDIPGAEGSTGPLVLKGPASYHRSLGRYTLEIKRRIDYAEGTMPTLPGSVAAYLWGQDTASAWSDADFANSPETLAALWEGDLADPSQGDVTPVDVAD
jgi:hypothetical protein